MKTHHVADYDERIQALHEQGLTPLEISVKIGDVLVMFFRPSEGFVRARLKLLGLTPHRSRRRNTSGPRAIRQAPALRDYLVGSVKGKNKLKLPLAA